MKRYDQNAFIVFVLLCGLSLLLSCRTTRHADTVTTIETRDTTDTRIYIAADTAAQAQRAELRDTIKKTDHVTGSLKIERDTAGRPVLYIWQRSALMHSTIGQNIDVDGLFTRNTSAEATDATATRAENVEKKEKTATKVGPGLEDYIGAGLMLFVLLYVLFVCVENLWRSRNK